MTAIVFPRAMPLQGVGGEIFTLQRDDYISPTNGGKVGAMSAGFPLWSGQFTLGQGITEDQSDECEAFIASLRGAQRLFLGRSFVRPYPRAYARTQLTGLTRAGGGSFNGTASSWSQAMQADGQALLTLTGLPANFVLSVNDFVDFRWTTDGEQRRALVRSLQSVTGSGGGSATFSVEPPVPEIQDGGPGVVPSNAAANLLKPECLMRLVPNQGQLGEKTRRRVIAGTKIIGLQDLVP